MAHPRPWRVALSLSLSLCLALSACVERPISKVQPNTSGQTGTSFAVADARKLDLLFVIDDSGSMEREQDQIITNFHRMIDVLEQMPGGLPDLHIGVVSTTVDTSAGPGSVPLCVAPVPGGVLRNAPKITGCHPPRDRFLSSQLDKATHLRVTNYDGDLADSFACIATLGTGGCGFEQPLEAIQRAIDPTTTENAGFLRDDALLAVVILSDEDDCSGTPKLWGLPINVADVSNGFRCVQHGVECDGGDMTRPGERTGCKARVDDEYMNNVNEYVATLKAAKPRAEDVLVAGILGKAGPVRIGNNSDGDLDLLRSCEIGAADPQGAFPPVRTDAFIAQFAGNNARASICDPDLSPAIQRIAEVIKARLLGSCVQGAVADRDPSTAAIDGDCVVTETRHPQTPAQSRRTLPRCDHPDAPDTSTTLPCWTLTKNEDDCASTETHLEAAVHYGAAGLDDQTATAEIECVSR